MRARSPGAAGLPAAEQLADGLARHFRDRVGFATAGLARHDGLPRQHTLAPAGAGTAHRELRRALFTQYPVLRRVVQALWSGWSAFAANLTARLALDLSEIRCTLLRDESAQPAWCLPGAGDSHHGGSVTIVGFSDGGRAVYRPRDCSHLAAWAAVLDLLAAADPVVRLRGPRMLQRDGYAWAEFIAEEPPGSGAERATLCRRIGMTARLLEVLGACDMSESNLVVARDQVVLVDTETIIAPAVGGQETIQPAGPGQAHAGGRAARAAPAQPLREPAFRTGAATGFLSLPMTMDARVTLRNLALPARADYAFISANVPLVLDGYAAMHRALASQVQRHGSPAPVLRPFEEARLRFLARSTHVYWILLKHALEPEALREEREFELRLGRLRRAAAAAPEAARAAIGRLVDAEVSALRALDIPYFEIAANSTDVVLPGIGLLPGYARASPYARTASRLMALGVSPADEELDTVCALIAAAAPAGIVGVASRAIGPARLGMSAGQGTTAGARRERAPDWAGCAAEVAAVLARRAGADDGALAFRPRNDVVVLERLAPDLLSGYAGLAVVLADAAALLGDRLLADQARALAVRVEEVLRRALPGLRVSSPRVALDPGAYCGLGALIYALGRVEAALGRADSRWRAEVAAELAGGDAVEHAAQHHGWDMSIATGTAGLVLALHATALSPGLAQWWPGFAMRTLSLSPGPDTGTHPIAAWFLPSAAASAEFTAAALGTSLPAGLSPPDTARAEQAVRVADRLLARVAAADRDGLAAASRAMAAAPGSWTSLAALCEIEAGLAAVGPAADAGTQLAERAAHLLVARKARTGTWFPEAVAPDRYRLSALWGLGAVCHAFVRLAAPSPVPSIRLIPRCRSAPAQPGLGAASGPLPQ